MLIASERKYVQDSMESVPVDNQYVHQGKQLFRSSSFQVLNDGVQMPSSLLLLTQIVCGTLAH